MDDEKFYQTVADELRESRINDALWTKAIAKSMGDEHKTKAVYIQLRVDQLMEEERRAQAQERTRAEMHGGPGEDTDDESAVETGKELGWLVLKGAGFVVGLYLIYRYLWPLGQELRRRFIE